MAVWIWDCLASKVQLPQWGQMKRKHVKLSQIVTCTLRLGDILQSTLVYLDTGRGSELISPLRRQGHCDSRLTGSNTGDTDTKEPLSCST